MPRSSKPGTTLDRFSCEHQSYGLQQATPEQPAVLEHGFLTYSFCKTNKQRAKQNNKQIKPRETKIKRF